MVLERQVGWIATAVLTIAALGGLGVFLFVARPGWAAATFVGGLMAAGVVAFGPSDAVADATLQELFEVNALGPIRLIRGVTPLLAQSATAGRSPFIVTISGIVSESPTAGLAAYSASKSAIAAFTTAVTRELRRAALAANTSLPAA